jgi:glutathione S-transferase
MKLYGNVVSSNTRKIMWALKELNLSYDFQSIDLMKGEHKQSAFLSINPNGRVPVLETANGGVISESNAILLYLASTANPEAHLYLGSSLSPEYQGQVYQWLLWQASDLSSTILKPWLMKLYAKYGAPFDDVEHEKLVGLAHTPLQILNQHLSDKSYVAGSFSVADIAIVEMLSLCEDGGISLQNYPNVASYLNHLQQRSAFIETRPQL